MFRTHRIPAITVGRWLFRISSLPWDIVPPCGGSTGQGPDPMGVTAFHRNDTRREGASFRPPVVLSLCSQSAGEQPTGSRFGSGLSASFDPLRVHGPSDGGSPVFSLRPSLIPGPPRCWQVQISPRGPICPRRGGYIVPAASYPTYCSADDPLGGRYSWILFGLITLGQVKRNRVPRWGGVLSIEMVPPTVLTVFRTIASPIPLPST